jgi:hypothetical protein
MGLEAGQLAGTPVDWFSLALAPTPGYPICAMQHTSCVAAA